MECWAGPFWISVVSTINVREGWFRLLIENGNENGSELRVTYFLRQDRCLRGGEQLAKRGHALYLPPHANKYSSYKAFDLGGLRSIPRHLGANDSEDSPGRKNSEDSLVKIHQIRHHHCRNAMVQVKDHPSLTFLWRGRCPYLVVCCCQVIRCTLSSEVYSSSFLHQVSFQFHCWHNQLFVGILFYQF